MKLNTVLLAVAAVALMCVGYREMRRTPQAHAVNDSACTPAAIKGIDNITERAIQSSRCAQRAKQP